ncbi:MAG TPA: hypothetical protein VHH14_09170 [Solirubrobacterales bacterium]|nr:hypothetical protein [Solirubrobacterales bacterium]
MDFDFEPFGGISIFLGIVLVVSIVAGSLPMIIASALILAVFAGFAYRVRTIKRDLDP